MLNIRIILKTGGKKNTRNQFFALIKNIYQVYSSLFLEISPSHFQRFIAAWLELKSKNNKRTNTAICIRKQGFDDLFQEFYQLFDLFAVYINWIEILLKIFLF